MAPAVLAAASVLAAALLVWPVAALGGAELAVPRGPVVLTVAGQIGATNRGPFDKVEDALLNHHEKSFERAAEFDLAMLEALGMHELAVEVEGWPRRARFQGPRLGDLLAAVDAEGDSLTVLALDGYAEEISREDLDGFQWIVAIKRDGRYLTVGQHGPAWVVYGRPDGKAITHEDEARWPWAVFYIDVQ